LLYFVRDYDPRNGRLIDCFTTEPAEQVYTSNHLNSSVVGSSGTRYCPTEAFTLGRQVDNQCGFLYRIASSPTSRITDRCCSGSLATALQIAKPEARCLRRRASSPRYIAAIGCSRAGALPGEQG
jgi:hypothetical protein